MRVLFIIFFLMAFVSLQALNFQDIFEIEYLISVAKATMLHGKCGNQRLDPAGSIFNSAEIFTNNFCHISKAQQIELSHLFDEIEQKWKLTQQNLCQYTKIQYPKLNFNRLFDLFIQQGSNAPMTSGIDQNSSNLWQYFQKGKVICIIYIVYNRIVF